ncbi:MAG: hypothetical protein JO307_14650 [Bryobacterales bacterium]|nr:hypothetical protein [Bryobacterales bacterium]MBV9401276.1 hypothetical protein [Bryobacterales bacterium]
MTDAEIQHYLSENGYPEHIVREGRAGLIRRWREFIEQVERGYSLGLEDYRNDLDIRAILRLAQAEDDPELNALDERLKRLLIATDRRVWESAPGDPFWDFGYPKNAGEELVQGLQEEGLL